MISEKSVWEAIGKGTMIKSPVPLSDKKEIVNRLIKAGLVEKEVKYYGVAMELKTNEFYYYEHNQVHEPLRGAVTMKNFFHNKDDAIELARRYNEVSL